MHIFAMKSSVLEVNCWCVFLTLFCIFFLPSIHPLKRKGRKTEQFFLGGPKLAWMTVWRSTWHNTSDFWDYFFSWTDPAIIIKFSQIKSDIRKEEVGNLRNRKGKGSLTTFFLSFWLLMSMIESFKLMSTASERASKRASVFLEKHTGCPSKFWICRVLSYNVLLQYFV